MEDQDLMELAKARSSGKVFSASLDENQFSASEPEIPNSCKETKTIMGDELMNNLNATYDNCGSFNNKLKDTLLGLINANNDRKSEIDGLRGDHDQLRKDFDDFQNSAERENDLRKNEIRSLEDRQQKDNQARIADIAKLEGKLDSENAARKAEIEALDNFAKGENDARKKEIEDLRNFAEKENDARKDEIANLDNFAKSENDGRKAEIADLYDKLKQEKSDREASEKDIHDRIDKEIGDREDAIRELEAKMDSQNDDNQRELEALRTKMLKENEFLRNMAGRTNSVYFDAYRTKAYDGGGEENLTYQGCTSNAGGGMDPETGIFTAPCGGTYLFVFHIATHDNKKALLSIRHNGVEIASVFDQNHKDNHKNSMAGTTIVLTVKRGDEVVVYAYTGTWLADFPMNHYTHFIGLLLKPSQEEIDLMRKEAEEGIVSKSEGEETQTKEAPTTNGF